ncbi:MAG: enoyl-CoA hydratase/isomerase family protein [Gemmatimonadaceae bacterium]
MSDSPPIAAGHVVSSVSEGVGTVSFFHPKGNSLPSRLLTQLASAIDEMGKNDEARVVVLRSEGTGPFCAGASFDELRMIANAEDGKRFFSGFAHVILAMRRCPKFVVTRVHGKAVGGGVGVVAASDYSIATSGAHLRLSELAIGIGPFVVGPVIERKIGHGHFSALSTDFDWRDSDWGARVGLYSRVEDSVASLDTAVSVLARRLAAAHDAAMTELKRNYWEGTDHWDTLLFERAATSGRLILSEHSRAAIDRFAAG